MVQMPADSVRALKETQSSDPDQWPGLIHSSPTTRLLKEGTQLNLCWLCDASQDSRDCWDRMFYRPDIVLVAQPTLFMVTKTTQITSYQNSLEIGGLESRMEAFVSRQDPLRKIFSVWIQVSCDGVRVRARAKRTNVQLIQLGNVLQEGLGVRPKFSVIPSSLRPQLEMVGVLTEHTTNNKELPFQCPPSHHQHHLRISMPFSR